MGLNPPLHTKHNECVGDCNEGNISPTIMRLGADHNEGGIFNTPHHAGVQWALKVDNTGSPITYVG